jgi:hypothetical protein
VQLTKMLTAGILAMLFFGCARSVERSGVDGVEGEFCLPSHLVPADLGWIPEDRQGTPRGFTVRGCAKRSSDDGPHCNRLGQIVSADISSRDNANFFAWKDFKKSALAVRFEQDSGTSYEIRGQQLVIKNENVWDQWLILSTRLKSAGKMPVRPQDDDVVMAACERIENFPIASRASTGRNFGCQRHAVGPHYSFDYRFVTDSEIPSSEELAALDANLIAQVDAWRCPAE